MAIEADPSPMAATRHARAILALGLPLVGSHLAQFAINLTDGLMIGRYDVTALAGLVIANALYFVVFIVGSGFAWAVMPMVAAAVSTGDATQVRRVTRMAMWLSILYGLATLPILVFAGPIFRATGQAPEVAAQGGLYLVVMLWGLIPNLLIMCLKSYLAALGRTRSVLVVTLGMAALNIALNYALIFGHWGAPELGIAGAALASVTLQVLGLVALGLHATRAEPGHALFRNPHRPDAEAFGRVLRLGWPIGLTNLAEVGLFAASSMMVGWIGTVALAAHGIALQIASATFMLHVGLSQAVTVLAGRAYGRGDREGLRGVATTGLALSLAGAGATVALFLWVPEALIGLFLAADDPALPDVLALGRVLLAAAALFQVVDATQVMTLGMLRGVQDTRVPMWLAAVSYWGVGIPASYGLGFGAGLGAVGVWIGLVIGLALAAGALSWRFWGRSSRI